MKERRKDELSPEETARRRDEVIRRMANTPPKPRIKDHRPRERERPVAADRSDREKGS
jgi:hypothetical protein